MPPQDQDKPLILRIDKRLFELPIGPEELRYTDPARQTVTQTIGDAYIDHWGKALGELSIRGNTGWGQGTRPSGYLVYHSMVAAWNYFLGRRGRVRFDVFIQSDGRAFRVAPRALETTRRATNPVVFEYVWNMVILVDLTQPPPLLDLSRPWWNDPVMRCVHMITKGGQIWIETPEQRFIIYIWPADGTEAALMEFCREVQSSARSAQDVAALNHVRSFARLPAGMRLLVPVAGVGERGWDDPSLPLPPGMPGWGNAPPDYGGGGGGGRIIGGGA